MPTLATATYTLDATRPVLLRPDGAVQIGWDPRRAVLVRPPAGLTASACAAVLRCMQTPATLAALQHEAAQRGCTETAQLDGLVAALVDARVVDRDGRRGQRRRGRAASIRVHGRGPLSDLLVETLQHSGALIRHSSQPHAAVTSATDLVVLADCLVADPRLVRDLHAGRVPHLPVRVRDGTGLVGPLVIPGVTSCLSCGDLHRRDRDAAWPAVAAQLRDTVAHADRATVLGTAALALDQVNRVIAAVRGSPDPGPPPTLNTTLEFDVSTGSISSRRWERHPLCDC